MTTSLTGAPTRLVARTTPLVGEDTVDLLAVAGDEGIVWEHEGAGLAGRGVAAVVDVGTGPARLAEAADEAARVLGEIEVHDEVGRPGCGPVAMGALPFADDQPGQLVVPVVVVGRAADGTAWVTTVAAIGEPEPMMVPTGANHRAVDRDEPATYRVTTTGSSDEWRAAVGAVRAEIEAGRLAKAVLAREVVVEGDRPFSPTEVLARLRTAYPACFLFSVAGLVGASPELLVARQGDEVRSLPLAGSAPRGDGPEADARLALDLLASPKEQEEHRLVVEAVVEALAPVCDALVADTGPTVVAMANVQHLATAVHGHLRPPGPSALALAGRLHPTPAVGGTPRGAALAAIARWEGLDRGRYAGPVGWVDARGDGQWAVAIRTAELDGHRARLVAGAGIVAGSHPEAELAETELKLQALLSAVARP